MASAGGQTGEERQPAVCRQAQPFRTRAAWRAAGAAGAGGGRTSPATRTRLAAEGTESEAVCPPVSEAPATCTCATRPSPSWVCLTRKSEGVGFSGSLGTDTRPHGQLRLVFPSHRLQPHNFVQTPFPTRPGAERAHDPADRPHRPHRELPDTLPPPLFKDYELEQDRNGMAQPAGRGQGPRAAGTTCISAPSWQ